MKKSFLATLLVLLAFIGFAQNDLLIQSSDKAHFLQHTVTRGENFYSIGRLFNIPPKEIAAFNKIDMNNGLNIGQVLQIPLTPANFTQAKDNGRPVYYVVGAKEGLYRVSVKNNNVLMANIRKWNHLKNDQVSTGQKLIVGYLVSPEADNVVAYTPPANTASETSPAVDDKPVNNPPVQEAPKETPRSAEPERKTSPPPVANNTPRQVAVSDGTGGFFRSQYEQQVKSQPAKVDETASAGIFKTASGWQDAKYYALMDRVEPGTIIRIVNPTNSKVVYAKVLGQMSGIRQNQGYDVRLSNAAASALEISDTEKFIVRVNY